MNNFNRPRYGRVSKEATALLRDNGVVSAPVPVDRLAESLGAKVVFNNFNDEISGLLLRTESSLIIGVAKEQPPARQRFTIAHEIGHILLHNFSDVHIDKNFAVMFRSAESSTAQDILEIEANTFAAELLMPESFIERELSNAVLDVEDDEQLRRLAKKYQVSAQAMTYRLHNLMARHRLPV
ncbi:ImmA/IrrE family metallo-endopeptidase [Burkholderia contaminans]|uniref:ImmA/IrrE family metallo-endopeptidase n=1 Tax=Burkholderia contaminans TaxID=488447 RepID=UPI001583CE21|nr:ImmA/IrrE family metallo-endopeptidase [Burkholderia contaminans]